jgi:hypothetical protein
MLMLHRSSNVEIDRAGQSANCFFVHI